MDAPTLSHFDGEKWIKITVREWLKHEKGIVGFDSEKSAMEAAPYLKEFGYAPLSIGPDGKPQSFQGMWEFQRGR